MAGVGGWVETKLRELGYSASRNVDGVMEVQRPGMPQAHIRCEEAKPGKPFGVKDLNAVLESHPSVEFIVVVPTQITHAAYARAEEQGVCVAGFGELRSALEDDYDVSQHVDTQERYERRRLETNRAVRHLRRVGHHAYRIDRHGLRSITIVTTNDYEFTADEMYTLASSFEEVGPELVVVTNPNCRGFSADSLRAAEQSGLSLVLFQDLLDNLGTKWT